MCWFCKDFVSPWGDCYETEESVEVDVLFHFECLWEELKKAIVNTDAFLIAKEFGFV